MELKMMTFEAARPPGKSTPLADNLKPADDEGWDDAPNMMLVVALVEPIQINWPLSRPGLAALALVRIAALPATTRL